eukprot:COSAG02_NODE_1144_length_14244_cov_16.832096_12_plen_185_part_00
MPGVTTTHPGILWARAGYTMVGSGVGILWHYFINEYIVLTYRTGIVWPCPWWSLQARWRSWMRRFSAIGLFLLRGRNWPWGAWVQECEISPVYESRGAPVAQCGCEYPRLAQRQGVYGTSPRLLTDSGGKVGLHSHNRGMEGDNETCECCRPPRRGAQLTMQWSSPGAIFTTTRLIPFKKKKAA